MDSKIACSGVGATKMYPLCGLEAFTGGSLRVRGGSRLSSKFLADYALHEVIRTPRQTPDELPLSSQSPTIMPCAGGSQARSDQCPSSCIQENPMHLSAQQISILHENQKSNRLGLLYKEPDMHAKSNSPLSWKTPGRVLFSPRGNLSDNDLFGISDDAQGVLAAADLDIIEQTLHGKGEIARKHPITELGGIGEMGNTMPLENENEQILGNILGKNAVLSPRLDESRVGYILASLDQDSRQCGNSDTNMDISAHYGLLPGVPLLSPRGLKSKPGTNGLADMWRFASMSNQVDDSACLASQNVSTTPNPIPGVQNGGANQSASSKGECMSEFKATLNLQERNGTMQFLPECIGNKSNECNQEDRRHSPHFSCHRNDNGIGSVGQDTTAEQAASSDIAAMFGDAAQNGLNMLDRVVAPRKRLNYGGYHTNGIHSGKSTTFEDILYVETANCDPATLLATPSIVRTEEESSAESDERYESLPSDMRHHVDRLREKIARMPRRKLRGSLASSITLEEIEPLMSLNRDHLATLLSLGVTTWKSFVHHELGVSRWPARSLKSALGKIRDLKTRVRAAEAHGHMKEACELRRELHRIEAEQELQRISNYKCRASTYRRQKRKAVRCELQKFEVGHGLVFGNDSECTDVGPKRQRI